MTPKLDTGAYICTETSLLLAPSEVTMMGELSWTSRSERRLERITTWIFVSESSWKDGSFDCFEVAWAGVGSRVGGSSGKRVDEADLDMTERDRGGGIVFAVVVFILARDDAGRRVAITTQVVGDEEHEKRDLHVEADGDQHPSSRGGVLFILVHTTFIRPL